MKKLLITGFEPFGGEEINPSWEAVSRLPSEINGYVLTKMRVPVVFGEGAEAVIKAAEEIAPDVIICVGQAGGREAITPELVAINLRHGSIPDNKGNQPKDEPIIEGGNAAYFSTLPVRKIADAISCSGIKSKVSYSAGTYVCNDLLYSLLAHFDGNGVRVGFIHIPYCKEQNKEPSMEICEIAGGIAKAINAITD